MLAAGVIILVLSRAGAIAPSAAVVAIAVLVLGVVFVSLGRPEAPVQSPLAPLLAGCAYDNTAALLQSLGVRDRAVYMPAAMAGGAACACVEIDRRAGESSRPPAATVPVFTASEGGRTMLRIATPGSHSLPMVDSAPGATLDEATSALTTVAAGTLRLAAGVHIGELGDLLRIRFDGYRDTGLLHHSAVDTCLGSPLAGIAATILAETLQTPIRYEGETRKNGSLYVDLRIERTMWYDTHG